MTALNKVIFFGAILSLAIGGATPSVAVDCKGFGALTTTVQSDLGTYLDLLKERASEREICGTMKRFFGDANLVFTNDYSVCTPKKKEYAAWLKEIRASVKDLKNDPYKAMHCSRFP